MGAGGQRRPAHRPRPRGAQADRGRLGKAVHRAVSGQKGADGRRAVLLRGTARGPPGRVAPVRAVPGLPPGRRPAGSGRGHSCRRAP
ncbi:hypothetical protein GBW32_02295 [Streptomyces tsukubensis]|nr:hypothetical protein GBW32_02295 [Streptomyces tsukubensis]